MTFALPLPPGAPLLPGVVQQPAASALRLRPGETQRLRGAALLQGQRAAGQRSGADPAGQRRHVRGECFDSGPVLSPHTDRLLSFTLEESPPFLVAAAVQQTEATPLKIPPSIHQRICATFDSAQDWELLARMLHLDR